MKLSDEAMDTGMGDLARSEITEVRVILGRRRGEREGREREGRGREGREGERGKGRILFPFYSIRCFNSLIGWYC